VGDQGEVKGYEAIRYHKTAITFKCLVIESSNWCQKKQKCNIYIYLKRTFCCSMLSRNKVISKKLYWGWGNDMHLIKILKNSANFKPFVMWYALRFVNLY